MRLLPLPLQSGDPSEIHTEMKATTLLGGHLQNPLHVFQVLDQQIGLLEVVGRRADNVEQFLDGGQARGRLEPLLGRESLLGDLILKFGKLAIDCFDVLGNSILDFGRKALQFTGINAARFEDVLEFVRAGAGQFAERCESQLFGDGIQLIAVAVNAWK